MGCNKQKSRCKCKRTLLCVFPEKAEYDEFVKYLAPEVLEMYRPQFLREDMVGHMLGDYRTEPLPEMLVATQNSEYILSLAKYRKCVRKFFTTTTTPSLAKTLQADMLPASTRQMFMNDVYGGQADAGDFIYVFPEFNSLTTNDIAQKMAVNSGASCVGAFQPALERPIWLADGRGVGLEDLADRTNISTSTLAMTTLVKKAEAKNWTVTETLDGSAFDFKSGHNVPDHGFRLKKSVRPQFYDAFNSVAELDVDRETGRTRIMTGKAVAERFNEYVTPFR